MKLTYLSSLCAAAMLIIPASAKDDDKLVDYAIWQIFSNILTGTEMGPLSPICTTEDGEFLLGKKDMESLEYLQEKKLIQNIDIVQKVIKASKQKADGEDTIILEIPEALPLKKHIQMALDRYEKWIALTFDDTPDKEDIDEALEYCFIPCPLTLKGHAIQNQLLLRLDLLTTDSSKVGTVRAADVSPGSDIVRNMMVLNKLGISPNRTDKRIATAIEVLKDPKEESRIMAEVLFTFSSMDPSGKNRVIYPFYEEEDGNVTMDFEYFATLMVLQQYGYIQNMDVIANLLKASKAKPRGFDIVLDIPEDFSLAPYLKKSEERINALIGEGKHKRPNWAMGPDIPIILTPAGSKVRDDLRKAYLILLNDVFVEVPAESRPKGKRHR